MTTCLLLLSFVKLLLMCKSNSCTRHNDETGTCYIDRDYKWIVSEGTIACDPHYANCVITCFGDPYSCGSEQILNPSESSIIFAPMLAKFTINCNSYKSCYGSIINVTLCSSVRININAMDQSAMTIYAPHDKLFINLLHEQTSFTSNSILCNYLSQSIIINCELGVTCTKNIINGMELSNTNSLCAIQCLSHVDNSCKSSEINTHTSKIIQVCGIECQNNTKSEQHNDIKRITFTQTIVNFVHNSDTSGLCITLSHVVIWLISSIGVIIYVNMGKDKWKLPELFKIMLEKIAIVTNCVVHSWDIFNEWNLIIDYINGNEDDHVKIGFQLFAIFIYKCILYYHLKSKYSATKSVAMTLTDTYPIIASWKMIKNRNSEKSAEKNEIAAEHKEQSLYLQKMDIVVKSMFIAIISAIFNDKYLDKNVIICMISSLTVTTMEWFTEDKSQIKINRCSSYLYIIMFRSIDISTRMLSFILIGKMMLQIQLPIMYQYFLVITFIGMSYSYWIMIFVSIKPKENEDITKEHVLILAMYTLYAAPITYKNNLLIAIRWIENVLLFITSTAISYYLQLNYLMIPGISGIFTSFVSFGIYIYLRYKHVL
eukprot:469790_1